jgi:putative two-component system response regulator
MDVRSSTILIVDDVPENLTVLGELLQGEGYAVRVARSGSTALRLARMAPLPDLILLDVMMPGIDGHEVLRQLRLAPATAGIPVMFLTALGEADDEEFGLGLGAADYLTKPIKPQVVLARVRTQLQAKRLRDGMDFENAALGAEVARRMAENEQIQRVTIRALAHLAETRDPETGNHILRTQAYTRLLAGALKDHPRFAKALAGDGLEMLVRSAPLHDIGKVGVPDRILLKPGKLTPEEWVVMKTHSELGAQAIEQAERDVDRPLAFLTLAKQIARSHHERWDGTGYPDGLAGDAIPVAARLMAVADVFDALVSPRVYKQAFSFELARQTLLDESGSHFDPDVVQACLSVFDAFVVVAQDHRAAVARSQAELPWPPTLT